MKPLPFLLLIVFCQLSFLNLFAQKPVADTDSVWMEGRVTDATTGLPRKLCEVQLLQNNETKALAFCDDDGYYTIGWVPAGFYTLSVISDGKTLHYAEFQLSNNAMVEIVLMPDSVNLHPLRPARIVASANNTAYIPISSPDDPRLWNLNGVEALWESGPAAKISGPVPRAVGFFNPGSLAFWRPRWLDAPFPHTGKAAAKDDADKCKNEKKKDSK